MARKKQFKAESKRLLDLMINSIYTHKEIFLRELISNASDAIDKLYYLSLTENRQDVDRDAFEIHLDVDREARTLTIRDNGLGMNKEELEENLGTIAKSGSLAFKQKLEEGEQSDVDIIGQFGVGFYSAFMVAQKVVVTSRKYGEEEAYRWESNASDGYTIEPCEKEGWGSEITLYLKDNTEEENYDEFLAQYEIERLIRKYSDYIRYPIRMEVEEQKRVEEEHADENAEPKYETIIETKTLNSMVPLWKRNKNDITAEEYNSFYKDKFMDFTDPQKVIHFSVEGNVSFTALLFIPGKAPMNYYSQDYKKGLQLYSRGVFIMDKAEDLIPEHFRFVKGLVDSQDLSLNISREMLQHDRQLKVIANRIEKKIKSELLLMLRNEREEYEKFWNNFGLQIKFGVYNDYGMHKDLLQDLLLFYSSHEKKLVTLDEYVARMPEDQKYIYFVSGADVDKIDRMPMVQSVKAKEYEILYLTDNVDEFALQALGNYKEKQFKNISQGDLDLASEEEKKEVEQTAEANKDLLEDIKEALKDKVQDVKISTRLVDDPVCMSSDEGMSFEMEKVLSAMPEGNPYGMKATRILEINPKHPIFAALQKIYASDKEAVKEYADVLYTQAMLIEGFPVEDPMEFSRKVCDIMVKAAR
ncbi:molecular chaperone HtpG [Amedibacillus dolichus]|uniref:Chaperone protein HtpG n=1 Tax=Amedibacillus dolichus TaxID=31971 RepID=A0ABT7UES3_9FIRM|nr:molecular chaperone HtpG [Amedibacillus dolichus]MDM8158131.1 molecular chaperone HtpG [Amedibacillus dolichus]